MVVLGGDGTVNEVLNGLSTGDIRLGVVPAGTANVLARDLGIRGPAHAVETILRGGERRMDLGVINGRRFLLMASVGFDAAVTRVMRQVRTGSISYLSYVGPILRTWWGFEKIPLRVEVDGAVVADEPLTAIVSNAASYSWPLSIVPRARSDDGLLDVCLVPFAGRLSLLFTGLGFIGRSRLKYHYARYHSGREIRVTAPREVDAQADGDWIGTTPFAAGICGRLRVCAPPGR